MVNSMYKNFIDAGIEALDPSRTHWFTQFGWKIKLASGDLKSAIVFLAEGNFLEAGRQNSDFATGWVLLNSDEINGDTSDYSLTRILEKLGVIPDRTVVVASEENWNQALNIVESWKGAKAVLFSDSNDKIFDTVYNNDGIENPVSRVMNSSLLQESVVFIMSRGSIIHTGDVGVFLEVVKYENNEVFPRAVNGYQKFIRNLMKLNDVIISSGDIFVYLKKAIASKKNTGTPTFLPRVLGDVEFGRQAVVQFDFSDDGGLIVFGSDIDINRKSESWGARKHTLLIENLLDGEKGEFQLGVLRREALDSLVNYSFMSETQSYAAFGLPSNNPFALDLLPEGCFRVSVLDESGMDITCFAEIRVLQKSFDNIKLIIENNQVLLEKGC